MLSTKISVAEEEDIQAELEALQQDQVCMVSISISTRLLNLILCR